MDKATTQLKSGNLRRERYGRDQFEVAPYTREQEASNSATFIRARRPLVDIVGYLLLDIAAPLAFIGWGLYLLVIGDGFSWHSSGPQFFDDYVHRAGLYISLVGSMALMVGLRRMFRNQSS